MFGTKNKDAAFFDAFTAHAGKSVEAARLLVAMLARMKPMEGLGNGHYRAADKPGCLPQVDDETRRLAAQIKEVEHAGDTITHDTVKRLRENWITPLDRNDIHSLISRMDDVLDLIDAVAERIVLFQVCAVAPQASELAAFIVRSCEIMGKAIALLPTLSRAAEIRELCIELNRLENASDNVYRKALAELFQPGNDPLTVMKWRDIYDSLESAVDRCEDVANVIEGIVLEYA
jgi:predicted phosphate transport protein (TIGR00153 family)